MGINAVVAVAAIVSAGAAAASAAQGAEAAKAQKKTQELETRRKRQQTREEARQARAAALAGATASGAQSGSSVQGISSALTSQEAGNLTFLNQSEQLTNKYYNAKINETIFAGVSASFGALADVSMSLGNANGLFGPKPGPATTGANSKKTS
jgi:hypothetical protein